MIQITVEGRRASVTNKEILTSGSVGIECQWTFSEDWAGLTKTAVFRFGEDGDGKEIVLTSTNRCVVPWEVLTEEGEPVFAGVYGINDETGTIVVPTVWASIGVVKPGVEVGTPAIPAPTPSEIDQVKTIANDALNTAQQAMNYAEGEVDSARQYAESANLSMQGAASYYRMANDKAYQADRAAGNANGFALTAGNYAQTASQSASEASQSATNAASSASTATAKASEANTSATTASQAAQSASGSATAAENSYISARDEASQAATSATTARGMALTAGNYMQAAAQSAAQAAGSATNASTAQTAAETAQGAAETAQGKAEDAQAAAEDAQGAAETAAASVSASAAQIAQNTSDISDLNRHLSDVEENQIPELKSATGAVADSTVEYDVKSFAVKYSGYKILETGLRSQDANYNIRAYSVTPGECLLIKSDDMFQFQTVDTVSLYNTDWRVGHTYKSGNYYLQVPADATYLVVSTPKTDSTANAYDLIGNERIDTLNDVIFDVWGIDDAAKVFPGYIDTSGVYHVSGTNWRSYEYKADFVDVILEVDALTNQTNIVLVSYYSEYVDNPANLTAANWIKSEPLINGIGQVNIYKDLIPPQGCKAIVITNRITQFSDPIIKIRNNALDAKIADIERELERIDNYSGVYRIKSNQSPVFTVTHGDAKNIFDHFRLGMVKDGKLLYWLNQADISKQENGVYNSDLTGTDGDVMFVNDCDVYYAFTGDDTYDIMLFSLTPFEFSGLPSKRLTSRGIAPCACYIDNINDPATRHDNYQLLGDGTTHCTINSNHVAYYGADKNIVGQYVPSESGGVISYAYDSTKHFISNGQKRATVFVDLRTAEKAALNKGTQYTNYDLMSVECMFAMMYAEYCTRYIGDASIFGILYRDTPTADTFANGTLAEDGMRFKDANDTWVYKAMSDTLTNSNSEANPIYTMLSNYTNMWSILEQHQVMSHVTQQNIAANTWFVYEGNEYKYLNVGTGNYLTDGIMSVVLLKKYRTKLDGIIHNGVDVTGNDAEFIVMSSLYRGLVLDTLPHYWITGIKAVLKSDAPLSYYFYGTENYKKYIMDRVYPAITLQDVYDFQKCYDYLGMFYSTGGVTEMKLHSNNCMLVPIERGGNGYSTYDCFAVQTDKKLANSDIDHTHTDVVTDNTQIVTGVKLGYIGGFSRLYTQHPESYDVALAGYTKFVCHDVEI